MKSTMRFLVRYLRYVLNSIGMGQPNKTMDTSERIVFDEKGDNGLLICGVHLPFELLLEIFCRLDDKSLLSCQLICKRWKMLIQGYVWRKKAGMPGRMLPRYNGMPWQAFYLLYKKRPFERNLLKNHSGQHGRRKYWHIMSESNRWTVEKPPIGVPRLPPEPVFEGQQVCFATSYKACIKMQSLDLVKAGFHPCFLDVVQPPIMVSEWYSSRWDCPASYECTVKLYGEFKESIGRKPVLGEYRHQDTMEGDRQNQWYSTSHVFEKYGPGLREITFMHSGTDKAYWAGHYGSKMAGACIYVKVPEDDKDDKLVEKYLSLE